MCYNFKCYINILFFILEIILLDSSAFGFVCCLTLYKNSQAKKFLDALLILQNIKQQRNPNPDESNNTTLAGVHEKKKKVRKLHYCDKVSILLWKRRTDIGLTSKTIVFLDLKCNNYCEKVTTLLWKKRTLDLLQKRLNSQQRLL